MDFLPLTKDEVIRLSPTAVMKHVLPDAHQAKPFIAELAENGASLGTLPRTSKAGAWLFAQFQHGVRPCFLSAELNHEVGGSALRGPRRDQMT